MTDSSDRSPDLDASDGFPGGDPLGPQAPPVRVGILGAGGQLGSCLTRAVYLTPTTELAFALTRAELDLTDASACQRWLDSPAGAAVDVVINAAAFTRVDDCESERERAFAVNAEMPTRWAKALAGLGKRFVHVSTDYVFGGVFDGDVGSATGGQAPRPYREIDPVAPKTVYGESKRAGEEGVLATDAGAWVVRTSWVFGPGRNFVVAMLEQAAKRVRGEEAAPLRVVNDQVGSPTYAADLAVALLGLCKHAPGATLEGGEGAGLLHICNQGETSWYGFAREILNRSGFQDVPIEPVPTSAFPTPAARPRYSVLDVNRAGAMGLSLRPWPEALSSYLSGPDRPQQGRRPDLSAPKRGSGPVRTTHDAAHESRI